jgi:hypothetical protein
MLPRRLRRRTAGDRRHHRIGQRVEPLGQRVQLRQLGGELELELLDVHALGLGDEEPLLQQLEFQLHRGVRLAQRVSFGLHVISLDEDSVALGTRRA